MVLLANHRGQSNTWQMLVDAMKGGYDIMDTMDDRVCVCSIILDTKGKKLNLKLALPELEVMQDGGILDKAV